MADETVTTEVEEPQEKASPLMDPLAPGLVNKPKITEEDKEKFFKCFLTDTAFTEEISMFDNQFKVTFKTLSVEENDDIMRQISIDQASDKAKNNDSYLIQIMEYRLGLSISELNKIPFQEDITKAKLPYKKDEIYYVAKRAEGFANWPTFKLSSVIEVFRTFETKVQQLGQEVQQVGFWKAAA